MSTAIISTDPRNQARNFALRGVAWSLGLFGLIRLGWFEAHAILPLTQLQARIAERGFGLPAAPVQITLACSGADALALCIGAILAYPTRWRMRLGGVAGGIALILGINIVRIGTLGRAAAAPSWFENLHVYAWPALLTAAIAGYVFGWMRVADRPLPIGRRLIPLNTDGPRALTLDFVVLTVAFLVIFTAVSPLYLESAVVLGIASFVARASALALGLIGVHASAIGNVLSTAKGGFVVTQECISTPLIPVYCAAVVAYRATWTSRALALIAMAPLFIGLGIARLLVVALPASLVGSPLFLVHAFYQLLFAAVIVCMAALWRHGSGASGWRRAALGIALGGVVTYLLSMLEARALASAFATALPLEDPQGAVALLPAFQVGLYVALAVVAFAVISWRPFVMGLAVLAFSQVVVFWALHVMGRHGGLVPQVRDVRAWALAGPLLVIAAMVSHERPAR